MKLQLNNWMTKGFPYPHRDIQKLVPILLNNNSNYSLNSRRKCSLNCLKYRVKLVPKNILAEKISNQSHKDTLWKCFAVIEASHTGVKKREFPDYSGNLDSYLNLKPTKKFKERNIYRPKIKNTKIRLLWLNKC